MRVQDNPDLANAFQRLVGMQDHVLGFPLLSDHTVPYKDRSSARYIKRSESAISTISLPQPF